MKKKICKKYIYSGFGFPLELEDVELVHFEGDWHPKLDHQALADKTIRDLALQETRYTGNHIKFIRQYFKMSLRVFATSVVNESHMAVSKWEKAADKITAMDVNIELKIRLYILDKLESKTLKQKQQFHENYKAIERVLYPRANN